MATSQGYKFKFIESVPDYLYCKKCTLVARRLSIISCCGESFCRSCIADTRRQGKPCPICAEKNFTTLEHIKNQKQITSLLVSCSLRERGCTWSGTLDQLDTHLDPDQDNCQYVDTKCPLNCQQTIPKNKVEQHVAEQCSKRAYVCQYCSFKATYEEVVERHLPECKYIPLQCPNLCGVTFERVFMEDHMNMCRLEEVGCEFSGVGCEDQFRREDQEKHARQNSQKHLTLTASLAVETNEHLQHKLLEQDKKQEGIEQKLRCIVKEKQKQIEEQGKKMEEENKKLEMKLWNQDQKQKEEGKRLKQMLEEQKRKLGNQDRERKEEEQKIKQKLKEQERKLAEQKEFFEHNFKRLEQRLARLLTEQRRNLQDQDKKQEEQEKKLKKVIEEQGKQIQELKELLDREAQMRLDERLKLTFELQKHYKEHESEKLKNLKKFEKHGKVLEEHQMRHFRTNLAVQKVEWSSEESARQTKIKLSPFLGH